MGKDGRSYWEGNGVDREIEQVVEQMQEEIDERVKDVENSSGFLTSKGKILSRSEWHATMLGVAPVGLAYLLPTPMGELFILMQLGYLRIGVKKWGRGEKLEGHLGDVTEEIAYTITFAFLATILFHFMGVGDVVSIDMTQVIMAMVGGA